MRTTMNRFRIAFLIAPAVLSAAATTPAATAAFAETLEIGAVAPPFRLPGVDGKIWSLADFSSAKVLAVIFTCNHCPTAQAYEDRIKQLVADYKDKGVAVVAISPNDPKAVRLDELGYTDLSDSLEEMKARAKDKAFNFPYLYDGDKQEVSRAYGPVATPHVFLFDKDRKLRFAGRINNSEKPERVTSQDTRRRWTRSWSRRRCRWRRHGPSGARSSGRKSKNRPKRHSPSGTRRMSH